MHPRCDPHDMKLVYQPGKELIMADFLSRAQQDHIGVAMDSLDTEAIDAVSRYTLATEMSRQHVNHTLQLLLKVMREGWPSDKRMCAGPIKCFWSVKADLADYEA